MSQTRQGRLLWSPESRGPGIEEEPLQELADRYMEYRQVMSGPFDPVRVLALTGQVLEALNSVLASAEYARGFCPTNVGGFRQ